MKKDGRHDPIEFAEGGMPVAITTNKRIPPAMTAPEFGMSWHEELEIKYIVSGTLRFYVDDEVFEAEAGDVVIFNPYESHATVSDGEGAVYHMILLLPSGFVGRLEGRKDDVYKAFTEGRLQFPHKISDGEIPNLVRDIAVEAHTAYGELAVAGLLRLFFAKLFASGDVRLADEAVVRSAKDKRRLDSVLSFIAEHPEEKLNLENLSEMCYMSKFYFSRFFKKTMRMGVHEYVDGIRRVKAEEMLLSNYKLEEIARAVGMKDEYYLSRWFKKTHGESPTKYRAKKSK